MVLRWIISSWTSQVLHHPSPADHSHTNDLLYDMLEYEMVTDEQNGHDMTKLLLRVTETAERLSFGRTETYNLIARGVIPSVRIDGAVRVPAAALEDYVQGLMAESRNGDDTPSPVHER